MDETTLEAMWCWDNETGEEILINIKTGQVICTKNELEEKDKV